MGEPIASPGNPACGHCWHVWRGPLLVELPDGMILKVCCRCSATRHMHVDQYFKEREVYH